MYSLYIYIHLIWFFITFSNNLAPLSSSKNKSNGENKILRKLLFFNLYLKTKLVIFQAIAKLMM